MRLPAVVQRVRGIFGRVFAAPLIVLQKARDYRTSYRRLDFQAKHSVASLWMNTLLSVLSMLIGVISIFVAINIFREQKHLQVVSNQIQEQQRREERNEKIKDDTAKAVAAFELNNIAPPPTPKLNPGNALRK